MNKLFKTKKYLIATIIAVLIVLFNVYVMSYIEISDYFIGDYSQRCDDTISCRDAQARYDKNPAPIHLVAAHYAFAVLPLSAAYLIIIICPLVFIVLNIANFFIKRKIDYAKSNTKT